MTKSNYAAEVFRFGGSDPYVDNKGRRFNLNHKHPAFSPEAVQTDGEGNIIDMPVLLRKPCFGRPEAYLRHGCYGIDTWRTASDEVRLSATRCDACPVRNACENVMAERIISGPEIEATYLDFHHAALEVNDSPFRRSRTVRLWIKFLHAIKRHDGWSNVNVDRARLKQLQLSEEKRANDNERRRAKRRAARSAGKANAQSITPDAMVALTDEAAERRRILHDLKQWRQAPSWIAKLSLDRCDLTVDVWIETMLFERAGQKLTSKAVAERLIRDGKDRGLSLNSLTTRVNDARKRIKRLEDDRGGDPVWSKFEWT